MYPSQLRHSAIVEVAPIRYSSAIGLLRMKLGFGHFKFPDDPSRNIFHLAEPSVCGSHGAHTHFCALLASLAETLDDLN